jgi:hypothetical protein
MRDLIRRILKEEVVSNSKRFTIEEIDLPDFIFENLLTEGRSSIVVDATLVRELNDYVKSRYNWPPNIKNEWCSNIKEKVLPKQRIVKYSCNKKFEIKVSDHWAQRLFRPDEADHQPGGKLSHLNILYPEKYEGLNLFFDYKDSINEYLTNSKTWEPPETKRFLLTLGDYQEIVAIRKEGKGQYYAEFITQIKGERFFDTEELKKTIRLYL